MVFPICEADKSLSLHECKEVLKYKVPKSFPVRKPGGKKKELKFESIDTTLYNCDMVAFSTSVPRLHCWLMALSHRYYSPAEFTDTFICNWKEDSVSTSTSTSTKASSKQGNKSPHPTRKMRKKSNHEEAIIIQLLNTSKRLKPPIVTITVFLSTGVIQIQGKFYVDWVINEFPILVKLVDYYVKSCEDLFNKDDIFYDCNESVIEERGVESHVNISDEPSCCNDLLTIDKLIVELPPCVNTSITDECNDLSSIDKLIVELPPCVNPDSSITDDVINSHVKIVQSTVKAAQADKIVESMSFEESTVINSSNDTDKIDQSTKSDRIVESMTCDESSVSITDMLRGLESSLLRNFKTIRNENVNLSSELLSAENKKLLDSIKCKDEMLSEKNRTINTLNKHIKSLEAQIGDLKIAAATQSSLNSTRNFFTQTTKSCQFDVSIQTEIQTDVFPTESNTNTDSNTDTNSNTDSSKFSLKYCVCAESDLVCLCILDDFLSSKPKSDKTNPVIDVQSSKSNLIDDSPLPSETIATTASGCSVSQSNATIDISDTSLPDFETVVNSSTTDLSTDNQPVKELSEVKSSYCDVLMITNSNGSRLDKNRIYKNKSVEIIVLKEKYIHGAWNYIKSCKLRPSNIVFHAADNDLLSYEAIDCFYAMRDLVNFCCSKFPNAEIIVSRVFPRIYDNPSTTDIYIRRANEFNRLITSFMGVKNTVFHSNFHTAEKPYFYDGIHVTGSGAAMWVRNLKNTLNPLLGLRPYSDYFST